MSVRRKVKTGCALVLAAVLLLTGQGILETRAAGSIDLNRSCSLTISVDIGWEGGSNAQYLDDLNKMTIPVSVYKVADVNETGQKYTPIVPFSGMDFSDISSETTAAYWQGQAAKAKEIVDSHQKAIAAGTTSTAISVTTAAIKKEAGSTAAASATINGLTTGLYLVVPEAAVAPDSGNQYTFTPYLVALPGLRAGEEGVTNDEWIYDVKVGLKPSMTPPGTPPPIIPPPTPKDEYGKLNITKNLQDFNESLGRTTFVFRVVGVDEGGAIKYEEVVSLDFDAPGNKTVTLDHIPAGMKVTVTEVYSGASYEVVGSNEQTVTIISDEEVRLSGQKEASVSFTNRYNGKNRVGYGVDNRFKSDGKNGWIWENPTKSANK